MNKNEINKLVDSIIQNEKELTMLGRKSLPLVLDSGAKLLKIRNEVKTTKKVKWTVFQKEVLVDKVKLSLASIWRYIKGYEISLVKENLPEDFDQMTVNQYWEWCGLLSKDTDTTNETEGGEGDPQGEEEKKKNRKKEKSGRKTPFEQFRNLLIQIQDFTTDKNHWTSEEITKLVKCGSVYVVWHHAHEQQIPIDVQTPVAEEKEAA